MERFRNLLRLYRESRELKLLHGGGAGAIERLLEAEALAVKDDAQPGLTALVRYRLGHLYLRRARGVEDLEEAEIRFREAAKLPLLGPWAAPYQLACLARLRAHRPGPQLEASIDRAWHRAAALVHGSPADMAHDDEPIALQHATFNLVELATFFLDRDHGELLRRAGRAQAEASGESAIVVGSGLAGRADVLPFGVAHDVVRRLGERVDGALVFTLPPGATTPRARARDGTWVDLGPGSARLLALLLLRESRSPRQLARLLAGDDAGGDGGGDEAARHRAALRKTVERTRDRLAALTGLPREAVLRVERGTVPALAAGLRAYGAVDLVRLEQGGA